MQIQLDVFRDDHAVWTVEDTLVHRTGASSNILVAIEEWAFAFQEAIEMGEYPNYLGDFQQAYQEFLQQDEEDQEEEDNEEVDELAFEWYDDLA